MKKNIKRIMGVVYIILAIFVTKFLLDRNDFGVFETNSSYYVSNSAIKEYSNTSLVKFDRSNDYSDLIGEKVYYFNDDGMLKDEMLESFDKENKTFNIGGVTYKISNMLGKPSNGYAVLGALLSFFTTKIVYLLLVILPVFLLLVYEVYLLVIYLKNGKNGKDLKNDKMDKKNKE